MDSIQKLWFINSKGLEDNKVIVVNDNEAGKMIIKMITKELGKEYGKIWVWLEQFKYIRALSNPFPHICLMRMSLVLIRTGSYYLSVGSLFRNHLNTSCIDRKVKGDILCFKRNYTYLLQEQRGLTFDHYIIAMCCDITKLMVAFE